VGSAAAFGAAVSLACLVLAWGGPLAPDALTESVPLMILFTLLPWVYALVQARRVADWPLGVRALAGWTALVGLLSGVVYLSRIALEDPGINANLTFALGPIVQGGLIGVVGFTLWIAGRWRA
jgi:hypothetical protein